MHGVREAGVEPARPKAPDPKSGVAAVTPLPREACSVGVARMGAEARGERAGPGGVWQAVAVPRDPRQIQLEIDAARESLAATLDQLVYRSSPTRLKAKGQTAVPNFLQTPVGLAAVGAVGLLLTVAVVRRIRNHD